jgi:membrane dipeptidase
MIEGLADQGGVIQINFASYFVDDEIRRARERRNEKRDEFLEQAGLERRSPEARDALMAFYAEHPLPSTSAQRVADHIDHAIALVGVDHVGLGSDFDGVSGTLPTDLADVSQYPNLVRALLEREYTDEEIGKIASGNVLRVWQAVEEFASAALNGAQ